MATKSKTSSPGTKPNTAGVIKELRALIRDMNAAEKTFRSTLSHLHKNFVLSGENLIHYLALRNHDIRKLQDHLHILGLSSLANSESHTLSQVRQILHLLEGKKGIKNTSSECTFEEAAKWHDLHTNLLLGHAPEHDRPHIMVTLSTEMAGDRKLMSEMMAAGMNIARINCAHDRPDVWLQMIQTLKAAMTKSGKTCKIYMDLAGPKIRIERIETAEKKSSGELKVKEGQKLWLRGPEIQVQAGKKKKKADVLVVEPQSLIGMIKKGETIYLDDGKFEAKVIEAAPSFVELKITRISAKKHILKPEKGINLPDTEITLPSLTEEDLQNLSFICQHADLVGYSFVQHPNDIEILRREIQKLPLKQQPAIILKIERLSAVQQLPALLLNGMKDKAFGVMIARGDLAVEIGFERLSEIQEEILWLCEAGHIPVIWATQVLETLNKTGYATRSEITDAAMSGRAECVMLNKGPFIVKTIETLDDILTRQSGHHQKKRYVLRPLGIARYFFENAETK